MSLVIVSFRVSDKKEAEIRRTNVLVRGSLGTAVNFFEEKNPKAIVTKAELSTDGLLMEDQFQLIPGAAGNESA